MEALKILEHPESVSWDYDEEADVLYLSLGEPRPALSVDLGEGLVARYDQEEGEVVGLTVIGFRERLAKGLAQAQA